MTPGRGAVCRLRGLAAAALALGLIAVAPAFAQGPAFDGQPPLPAPRPHAAAAVALQEVVREGAVVLPVAEGSGRISLEPPPRRERPTAAPSGEGTPWWQAQAAPQRTAPRPLVGSLEDQDRVTLSRADGRYLAGEVVVPVNKSQVLRVDQAFDEVSVGNPEVADVVPLTNTSIYVFGKELGSTNLTLIGEDGRVIAVVDLVVTFDLEGLKGRLFELVPDARVEVRPAADAIVLSGELASPGELAQILDVAERYAPGRVTNLMRVTGNQQVMLQVRFAEVQRDTVKQLGLSSQFFGQFGGTSLFLDLGDGVSLDPPSIATGVLSIVTGTYSLDLLFDALEQKGLVKTLAEPNLIALSGDTASFLAGGEFPIPVGRSISDGVSEITIEFKEFGVALSFTPTVIGPELMNLVLITEVSEIDPNVSINLRDLVIPGLKVRRAKTTVELRDGQSFAVAGLLQDDFRDQVRQFPLLGDLPILGTLFRSTQFQRNQTELVVIVTPRLVEPVSAGMLSTPVDNFVPPTDFELFLLGRIEGQPRGNAGREADAGGQLARDAAAGLVGAYGYILE